MYGTKRPDSSKRITEWNKKHSGKKSPVYGLKRNDLIKRNKEGNFIRTTKKIICVELNKCFNSLIDANQYLVNNNLIKKKANLTRALKTNSIAGGFHWKYCE